jgi:hypothetical protein
VTPVEFDDLPASVHAAITVRTGPVVHVDPVRNGPNPVVAARIDTACGPLYVKALRTDAGPARTQEREAVVNPHVRPFAAELRWRVVVDGWDVLAFEAVDGRRADYTPGSPDLPRVARTLAELARLPAPDLPLRRAESRMSGYLEHPEQADRFRGRVLVHSDLDPANLLVERGGRVRVVDWGRATLGAPWLDAAHWIVRLIAAGHSPEGAEIEAGRVPTWESAPEPAVNAFAGATARVWDEIAARHADPWTAAIRNAAVIWAAHRARRH